jgi:hypothetical protein
MRLRLRSPSGLGNWNPLQRALCSVGRLWRVLVARSVFALAKSHWKDWVSCDADVHLSAVAPGLISDQWSGRPRATGHAGLLLPVLEKAGS